VIDNGPFEFRVLETESAGQAAVLDRPYREILESVEP
jgi:hypothetical protein